jgi:hypothetical protein
MQECYYAESEINLNIENYNDEVSMTKSDSISQVIEKFDSCCSRNISGTKERLLIDIPTNDKIIIRGFNNSTSEVDAMEKIKMIKLRIT